jgi:hypothetical protein
MLRRVALVRTDVSEELSASFIRVTRIGELGTRLAVTSKLQTQALGPFTLHWKTFSLSVVFWRFNVLVTTSYVYMFICHV